MKQSPATRCACDMINCSGSLSDLGQSIPLTQESRDAQGTRRLEVAHNGLTKSSTISRIVVFEQLLKKRSVGCDLERGGADTAVSLTCEQNVQYLKVFIVQPKAIKNGETNIPVQRVQQYSSSQRL